MSDLIKAYDLVKSFPVPGDGMMRAVNSVSFTIRRGETLALVGESGCGKTTLARAVAMLDAPNSGSVMFDGVEITSLSAKKLKLMRRNIQMIFQDPYASLNPRLPVASIIAEPLVIHRLGNSAQRRDQVIKLARDVGLKSEDLKRYPHQFSGGQRQRIAIARALALKPDLIIADEPVSALDVSIQSQILNLLQDLRDEYGSSYLFISHDLAVVRHFAERLAVMYLGRIVEEGDTEELFASPLHPYTRALIGAAPKIGQGKKKPGSVICGDIPSASNPPPGCPFHPRCPLVADICKQELPGLEPANTNSSHKAACHFKGM